MPHEAPSPASYEQLRAELHAQSTYQQTHQDNNQDKIKFYFLFSAEPITRAKDLDEKFGKNIAYPLIIKTYENEWQIYFKDNNQRSSLLSITDESVLDILDAIRFPTDNHITLATLGHFIAMPGEEEDKTKEKHKVVEDYIKSINETWVKYAFSLLSSYRMIAAVGTLARAAAPAQTIKLAARYSIMPACTYLGELTGFKRLFRYTGTSITKGIAFSLSPAQFLVYELVDLITSHGADAVIEYYGIENQELKDLITFSARELGQNGVGKVEKKEAVQNAYKRFDESSMNLLDRAATPVVERTSTVLEKTSTVLAEASTVLEKTSSKLAGPTAFLSKKSGEFGAVLQSLPPGKPISGGINDFDKGLTTKINSMLDSAGVDQVKPLLYFSTPADKLRRQELIKSEDDVQEAKSSMKEVRDENIKEKEHLREINQEASEIKQKEKDAGYIKKNPDEIIKKARETDKFYKDQAENPSKYEKSENDRTVLALSIANELQEKFSLSEEHKGKIFRDIRDSLKKESREDKQNAIMQKKIAEYASGIQEEQHLKFEQKLKEGQVQIEKIKVLRKAQQDRKKALDKAKQDYDDKKESFDKEVSPQEKMLLEKEKEARAASRPEKQAQPKDVRASGNIQLSMSAQELEKLLLDRIDIKDPRFKGSTKDGHKWKISKGIKITTNADGQLQVILPIEIDTKKIRSPLPGVALDLDKTIKAEAVFDISLSEGADHQLINTEIGLQTTKVTNKPRARVQLGPLKVKVGRVRTISNEKFKDGIENELPKIQDLLNEKLEADSIMEIISSQLPPDMSLQDEQNIQTRPHYENGRWMFDIDYSGTVQGVIDAKNLQEWFGQKNLGGYGVSLSDVSIDAGKITTKILLNNDPNSFITIRGEPNFSCQSQHVSAQNVEILETSIHNESLFNALPLTYLVNEFVVPSLNETIRTSIGSFRPEFGFPGTSNFDVNCMRVSGVKFDQGRITVQVGINQSNPDYTPPTALMSTNLGFDGIPPTPDSLSLARAEF